MRVTFKVATDHGPVPLSIGEVAGATKDGETVTLRRFRLVPLDAMMGIGTLRWTERYTGVTDFATHDERRQARRFPEAPLRLHLDSAALDADTPVRPVLAAQAIQGMAAGLLELVKATTKPGK